MQLESLEIEHFRSIEKIALPALGSLNVLIGKNNAGKSNILSAVDVFFSFFALNTATTGGLVFGEQHDFHQQNCSKQIKVVGCLHLTDKERDSFWNCLSKEFAELKIDPPKAVGYCRHRLQQSTAFFLAEHICSGSPA